MSRVQKPNNLERSKVKFRFVEFELEGGNQSVEASIRSLALGLTKAQALSGPMLATKEKDSEQSDGPDLSIETAPEYEEREAGEPSSNEEKAVPRRRVSKPKILDMDLKSGDVPLEMYVEQKAPSEVATQRYLVISGWLKEHRKLTDITIDHIHTCYRHMGWHTPNNVASALDNMTYNYGWFYKGEAKGTYKLNHIGENELMKMGTTAG